MKTTPRLTHEHTLTTLGIILRHARQSHCIEADSRLQRLNRARLACIVGSLEYAAGHLAGPAVYDRMLELESSTGGSLDFSELDSAHSVASHLLRSYSGDNALILVESMLEALISEIRSEARRHVSHSPRKVAA